MFYGLIQFRNYQANNFNILFLAFSCNVLKKHFTILGEKHITKIVHLVQRNFDQKDKSDEYEMFLGKSGKNKLEGKEDYVEYYKTFANNVVTNHYFKNIFETDNLDNYITTSTEYLEGNQVKVLQNLSYLELNGELARCINFINLNRVNLSFTVVNNLFEKLSLTQEVGEHLEFVLATSLSIIGDSLSQSKKGLDLVGTKTTSFMDSLNIYC